MADKIEDGGPAYPVECYFEKDGSMSPLQTSGSSAWVQGLSIRDWFAGQALSSVGSCWSDAETRRTYAKRAYQMADAMLKASKGDA